MSSSLLNAMALLLVVEGLLPFLSPALWRETFHRLIMLSDGQLRFMGLLAMVCGLLLMHLAGGD